MIPSNYNNKLYLKRRDIHIETLKDLAAFESKKEAKAGLYDPNAPGGQVDLNVRDTTVKWDVRAEDYPDVCATLLKMIPIWDPSLDPDDFEVREFNYLRYDEGGHFTPHSDQIVNRKDPNHETNKFRRIFSTSTIISLTEDIEGGEFVIQSGDGFQNSIMLEESETIFFHSITRHGIAPVKKGTREVLVAWIYNKKPFNFIEWEKKLQANG